MQINVKFLLQELLYNKNKVLSKYKKAGKFCKNALI